MTYPTITHLIFLHENIYYRLLQIYYLNTFKKILYFFTSSRRFSMPFCSHMKSNFLICNLIFYFLRAHHLKAVKCEHFGTKCTKTKAFDNRNLIMFRYCRMVSNLNFQQRKVYLYLQ